jgi:hypothetical protein
VVGARQTSAGVNVSATINKATTGSAQLMPSRVTICFTSERATAREPAPFGAALEADRHAGYPTP